MENLNGRKKLTAGRRKIDIKKIQKKASLQVTFTKRRTGLFKKASELCILCGSELSIIVQSPAKKFYAFHSPSAESTGQRFDDDARTEYEEAVRMLEEKNEMIKLMGFYHRNKTEDEKHKRRHDDDDDRQKYKMKDRKRREDDIGHGDRKNGYEAKKKSSDEGIRGSGRDRHDTSDKKDCHKRRDEDRYSESRSSKGDVRDRDRDRDRGR